MSDGLNEEQRLIAETLEGFIVVDAGPGTGKTYTIMKRYLNLVKKPDILPTDILLLTFTNNAAQEMRERIILGMTEQGLDDDILLVQASTFSSFCMNVVLSTPDPINRFLGVPERLSRSARLVQNESLNLKFFRQIYLDTLQASKNDYGNVPSIIDDSASNVYEVIKKLMTLGIIPLPNGWFKDGQKILEGDLDWMRNRVQIKNSVESGKKSELYTLYLKQKKERELIPLDDHSWTDRIPETVLEEVLIEDRQPLMTLIHDVYLNYIRRSLATNRLNFGLLELFAFIVLYSDARSRQEHSYPYVMIDEFQDTNELQFMISLLLLRKPNLCTVGDWKQGIYGFRYASIDNITDFQKRMESLLSFLNRDSRRVPFKIPSVMKMSLKMNYRSHAEIIHTSFKALECRGNKKEQLDREWLKNNVTMLEAANLQVGLYGGVEFLQAESVDEQYDIILDRILSFLDDPETMIADGDTYRRARLGDMAVLMRAGSSIRALKARAEKRGIAAYLQGDVEVMSMPEGKLLLAWLRYLNDPYDRRGTTVILDNEGCSLRDMERLDDPDIASEHQDLLNRLQNQRNLLLKKKRRVNALVTSIFQYYDLENDICQSIIGAISAVHRETLLTIPDIIALIENDIEKGTNYPLEKTLCSDAVCIQTMHGSKGLEYPIVFVSRIDSSAMPVTDRRQGVLQLDRQLGIRLTKEYLHKDQHHGIYDNWRWPLLRSLHGSDYDEERRLFFVALSRAKQYLCITCAKKPSMFMEDLSEGRLQQRDVVTRKAHETEDETRLQQKPLIPPLPKRLQRASVHALAGKAKNSGGKGKEYGRRVHLAAEMLVHGKEPEDDFEEIARIRSILEPLREAELHTEIECFLPLQNVRIRGAVDLLAILPDRVEIHDFKTDGNRINEKLYQVQLSVYAHAAATLNKPVHCYIQYLSQGITVELNILSLEELEKRALKLAECNDI